MAEIDDLIKRIEALPLDSGALELSASALATPATDAFFKQVVQAPQLRLAGAKRTPGDGLITVSGTTDLLSHKGITADITFATDANGLLCTVEGTFAGNFALPLVTWIKLRKAGLSATLSQPFNIVRFGFIADLAISDTNPNVIPIRIVEVNPSTWQFELAQEINHKVTVEDLVALLSGNALTGFLPPPLVQALDGLVISDLSAILDFHAKQVVEFSLGLTVTNGWPDIIPGFGLAPGLQLILALSNPTDPQSRQTVGIVRGTLQIGHTDVPVFAQVTASAQPTSWLIGLEQDPGKYRSGKVGVTLPTIAELFSLVSDHAVAFLPDGLRDLPAIALTALQVAFTTSPARLQSLTFAAATTSAWKVIDGFLTIENLTLSLNVVRPPGDDPLRIGGSVGGTFAVSDLAAVYLQVAKDPAGDDWTLTGALAPDHSFNLTDIVAKMLSGLVALPDQVPQIVFDTVSVTAVPGKSFAFTAGSTTPWHLLSGLSIDSFALSIDYRSATPKGVFTGSLDTKITVAAVPISISAALDTSGATGWRFEGATEPGTPIDVLALIKDIAQKFGVTVQTTVSQLTLRDLRLSFVGGTAADGAPASFGFGCEGFFAIAGVNVTASVAIDLKRAGTTYDKHVTGTLTIAAGARSVTLTVKFNEDVNAETIEVSWTSAPGHELTVDDAAKAFGFSDIPDLPDDLRNLGLADLHFTYDFKKGALAIELSISSAGKQFAQAVLVHADRASGGKVFAIGLTIKLGVRLADLPLVGSKLPDAEDLGIDEADVWILGGSLAKDDIAPINTLLTSVNYPALPEQDIGGPLLLHGLLRVGAGDSIPLTLDFAAGKSAQPAIGGGDGGVGGGGGGGPAPHETAPSAADDGTKWLDVQRQIGIFQFNRIGIGYSAGALRFALDAGMTLGPLAVSLNGLSISSPLTEFKPSFDLSGMGLGYSSGSVEIAGALLKLPGSELSPLVSFQYDGTVGVKAGTFSISGIGSYAQLKQGDPSLFLFAQLEAPLGGPPAFFVTGLMAGFGLNRSLAIPAQDEVLDFPLLNLAQPPAPGKNAPAADPMDVLRYLNGEKAAPGTKAPKAWITPQPGSIWFAAGIAFTSFEMVHSRALLIIQPTGDLTIALLGLSTMQLPVPAQNAPTYAYVELQLRAVLQPNDGVVGITAILSRNSYVLTPDCHLTGGFAFYLWFGSSPHAGDFVVTLGGYHPAFKPPSHYPTVPRLGLNWAVSHCVSIKGGVYFALTPSCVMGGGGLEVLFQDGDLSAWFTAHANFLMSWRPFYFVSDIDVSIGVAYRMNLGVCHKTISISIGASVDLWGPPTGGVAHIHLVIVTFTVGFGSDSAGASNQPVDWTGLKSLLPHPTSICTVAAGGAISSTADSPGSSSGKRWVVKPRGFSFTTRSAIPASQLQVDAATPNAASWLCGAVDASIPIRPMNKTAVQSVHQVKISRDAAKNPPIDLTGWSLDEQNEPMPEALWSPPPDPFTQVPTKPDAKMTGKLKTGYRIAPPPPKAGASPGLVPLKELAEEYLDPPGQAPLSPKVTASPNYVPTQSTQTIADVSHLMEAPQFGARADMFAVLRDCGLYAGGNGSLAAMAAQAGHLFADPPLQQA